MDRAQKAEQIASLSEKFGKAKAAFVVDFKGMNVEQVTTLRKTLRPAQSEMRVVRNTLARRALKDHPEADSAISKFLVGTNAFVFAYDDVSASAKVLADFMKTAEQLDLKVGVMDGKAMSKDQVTYLATLPSKDVLRAQLLGLMAAPASKFVRLLNAVPSGFVRVLAERKSQLGS